MYTCAKCGDSFNPSNIYKTMKVAGPLCCSACWEEWYEQDNLAAGWKIRPRNSKEREELKQELCPGNYTTVSVYNPNKISAKNIGVFFKQ